MARRSARPGLLLEPQMMELLVRLREEEESLTPPGIIRCWALQPDAGAGPLRCGRCWISAPGGAPRQGLGFPLCSVNRRRPLAMPSSPAGCARNFSRNIPADSLGFEIDLADAERAMAAPGCW